MAMDNPSYFTIPGGLSAPVNRPGRFSLLRRHVGMGSSSSTPSQQFSPAATNISNHKDPQTEERYSTPPSSATVRRSFRSLVSTGSESPVPTQMLVLGMPRASDIAPNSSRNHSRHASMGQPYRSTTDLFSNYYNVGATAPPSRRHSIGAYFVRKPMVNLTRKQSTIDEVDSSKTSKVKPVTGRSHEMTRKGSRSTVMEDIIIISSKRSQAADLWVTYLTTCFEQIRKNRNKPPFRILSINIEDIEDTTAMSTVLESKLRQARLEIVILCPDLLEHVSQHSERSTKLTSLFQPSNVLAMLLGIEEKNLTEQHRAALVSFTQWRKMESVKDRDEKFVSDFLGAAMDILGKSAAKTAAPVEKCQFMLVPKKVNQGQKKVVVVLNEPIEKDDVMKVTIVRNGEENEVHGIKKHNPFTLAFRVPDIYMGSTSLVSVRITRNAHNLGSKQLKCESQLHSLEQILRICDNPMDFTCQALNIVPTDKAKLDEFFIRALHRNVPPNFNLLQSAGLGQVQKGAICKEEYPTLLHFAARFGLEQLSWFLLECPGGDVACDIRNAKEQTPAEMADAAGHTRLSNLLCGYMQMTHFSSAYSFLKGMVDNKQPEKSAACEEYLNPRPANETYQVPPSPRPCPPPETPPPPTGYLPMRSPLGKMAVKLSEADSEISLDLLRYSREKLFFRSHSEDYAEVRKKEDSGGYGVEEELIEIINDFKNNVFTISEVESLVEQWRRRNDVQQSFREKQEHLTKLREEYERVQQKMKEEMKVVGRPSPLERIRNFFRGKSKEGKTKKKAEKRQKSETSSTRPASSLSILSSASSSSGHLSTASGGSSGDSSIISDAESDRRYLRTPTNSFDHYDIPPSPIALFSERQKIPNYDIPPSTPIEVAAMCIRAEYCNLPDVSGENIFNGKLGRSALKTVEEEKKTDQLYINLPDVTSGDGDIGMTGTLKLPEYVNVEPPPTAIQLKCV